MKKFAVIVAILSALILSVAAEGRTIVFLPLDKSPVADECGNTWTAEGPCTISDVNPKTSTVSPRPALQLDGESYLQLDGGIILGGKDFTIDGWAYVDSTSGTWARIFEFNVSERGESNRILLTKGSATLNLYVNSSYKTIDGYMDELFHFACVYDHAKGSVSLYLNGELKDSVDVKLQPRKYSLAYVGKSAGSEPLLVGYVYGFRVTDGEALWKDSFTPPEQYSFVPPMGANLPAGNGTQFMCPCCKYFLEHYGGQLPASK